MIGNPPGTCCAPTRIGRASATARAVTDAELRFFRDSRRLHAAGQRSCQSLPVVSRARVAAHQARRPHRFDSAVGHRHRSRQRRAAPAPVRSHGDRHLARLRQPPPHISHPSQHAVRVAVDQTAVGPTTLKFRCGLTDPRDLEPMRDRPRAHDRAVAPRIVESRPCPSRRSPIATALAILSGISSRVPALGDAAGWNVRFGRELNATDDRPHFVPLAASRGSACCRSSRASCSRRFRSTSIARPPAYRRASRATARSRAISSGPDRLPRRRRRHQQADADCRAAARGHGVDPHRVCRRRHRSMRNRSGAYSA